MADGLAEIATCRETYAAGDTTIIKNGNIMPIMGSRLRPVRTYQSLTPIEQAVLGGQACALALKNAKQNQRSVLNAYALKPVIDQAAQTYGADPRMMGAIAMKETGANADIPDSRDGGIGIFQLTHQRGVIHGQAKDPVFAANYAAKFLASNASQISKSHPRFTPADRLLATAASYNLGPSKFSGDPARIDEGSVPNGQYGHLVLGLMNCLPNPW